MGKRCILNTEMALDISLRWFSLLPRFIQTGNEGPRREHYVRRGDEPSVEGSQDTGGRNEPPPKKPSSGKYRSLSDLTIGEVEDAAKYFSPQLVGSPAPEWLARNYFCQIPLQRTLEVRPSVVFGRIGTCYPAAGDLENLEEMEMHFPCKNAAPDLLQIRYGDISRRGPIQSYCIGVKLHLSERERVEFSYAENGFYEMGFAPLYETGYGELLDASERRRPTLPWVYVFGSEWFATVPDSLQVEVKLQVQNLLRWNRVVLNYHPRRYLLQYKSLNDELEFNYGFSDHYLFMPQDPGQVTTKVDEMFAARFMRGMYRT